MTSSNPFILPGFGQSGDLGSNPVMASMDMMRKAWESLAGQGGIGGLTAPSMAATLSAEDLERRITDLRAVENWLRMNLTVLASTIQGLEVQRATLATFKSFVHNVGAFAGQERAAQPGAAAGAPSGAADASAGATAEKSSDAKPAGTQPPKTAPGAGAAPGFDADQAVAATQAWWDMLRQQFDSLAAATAASMPAVQPAAAARSKPTPRKAGAKTASSRATTSRAGTGKAGTVKTGTVKTGTVKTGTASKPATRRAR